MASITKICEGQQAHRARQYFRLRPGRALSRPAGLRPDRAGHGRADVDHRPAGARSCARRHPDRRSVRRSVLRARHHGRAARTRDVGRGPMGQHLAAAGADFHARLPGRALAADARSRQAGRQQSSDQHPDRRVQDQGRPHQHCLHRPGDVGAALQRAIGAGADQASRLRQWRPALEKPRRPQRRDRQTYGTQDQRRVDRHLQQCRRALRADLFDRPDVRRSAGQASRHRAKREAAGRQRTDFRRPAGQAVAHPEQDRGDAAGSASTPTRCSRNSASPTRKSPSCMQAKAV